MTNPLDTIEKALVLAQDTMNAYEGDGASATGLKITQALTALRQIREVDVEGLKKDDAFLHTDLPNIYQHHYRQGWNDCIDHLASRGLIRAEKEDRRVDDLACIVRQFVHKSRDDNKFSDLRNRAMDYLRRKDLVGSPLRQETEPDADRQRALAVWNQFYKHACEFEGDVSAYGETISFLLDHNETIRAALGGKYE